MDKKSDNPKPTPGADASKKGLFEFEFEFKHKKSAGSVETPERKEMAPKFSTTTKKTPIVPPPSETNGEEVSTVNRINAWREKISQRRPDRPAGPRVQPSGQEPSKTTPAVQPNAGTSSGPSISEFRSNTIRQKREQSSTSNFLSLVGYSLLGGLILVAGLAGFGGYILWKQIQDQSVTVTQLDAKYAERVFELNQQLQRTQKTVDDLSKLNERQFLMLQDGLKQGSKKVDQVAADGREEQKVRVREVEKLLKRIKAVEKREASRVRS